MVRSDSTSGNRVALHWYVGSLVFGWTLVTVGLLIWQSIGHYDYARVIAQAEAGLPFQMKPLYMLRQLHEIGQDVSGFRTHIASLRPLRPENAPDLWEAAALRAIVNGSEEVSSVETIDGAPYLRRMQPLIATAGCINCHRAENYKPGDICGGISVSVTISDFQEMARTETLRAAIFYSVLWAVGVCGIVFTGRRLACQVQRVRQAEEELRNSYAGLETTVQRRTAELAKQIEERKEVEEALRESQEQFRSIVSVAQDAIIMIDPQGRISLWNQSAERVFGYSAEEAVGQHLHRLLVPARLHEAQEKGFAEFVRSGEGAAMGKVLELPALRKDGNEFPVEMSLAPVQLHGQWHAVGVVRDITERKRAEEVLRDSEARHRILFESSSDAVMTVAPPSWKFTSCNPATVKMFNVKDEAEFTALGPWQVSPEVQPDGRPSAEKAKEMIETAMREGSHFFEWTHKRLNGEDFPATVLLTRMELAGQALLQATVRDISQWKNTRDREARSLRRLEGVNQLREGLLLPGLVEDKFKRITAAAVKLLDLDFCRIWSVKPSDRCNHGCIHATETEEQHACLRRDKCLHLMASSGRYTHTDGNHRRVPIGSYKIGLIASGKDRSFLTNKVTTDPRVHNHEWAKSLGLVSFAGYKLSDGNGEPIGVLATFAKHPILEEDDAFLCNLAETTSKVIRDSEVQAELREKTKQALLATQAKSEFLANMSHEIRTPMTAILGYTDLLIDPALNPSTRNNYLAVIRRSGAHLLHLISDILDLSKIEAGQLALDRGRCHLVTMLAEVASMMRPRAEQRGNALSVEYAGRFPETIDADDVRLRQAVVNLVGNAIKFTERGSVRIRASFLPEWRAGQAGVRIEVIDTGIGIRAEVLPQLFRAFTQADSTTSRKFGGTGLGLAISRHIAQMHGGELTVASEFGRGSTFTLTVPTDSLDGIKMLHCPTEAIAEAAPKPGLTTGKELAGARILLAEDGFDNQQLIRALLCQAGAEVEIAENGRMAVAKADAEPFDVILMDMNMPEMDGYEATRLLRSRGYSRPILALTANAMAEDSACCLAAGCNDYLTKPIDRTRLIRTIACHVGRVAASDEPAPELRRGLSADADQAVFSQFADDAEMTTLLDGFVARLHGQVAAMHTALAEHRCADLQRAAHQIKGSGGSYGYPTLTTAAAALEDAAKAGNAAQAATALELLTRVCRAVEEGRVAVTARGQTTR